MTRTESAKASFEGCLIDTDAVLHAPFTTYMMAAMPWFASMPHSVSGQWIAHGGGITPHDKPLRLLSTSAVLFLLEALYLEIERIANASARIGQTRTPYVAYGDTRTVTQQVAHGGATEELRGRRRTGHHSAMSPSTHRSAIVCGTF
jgi:hypothetical protein